MADSIKGTVVELTRRQAPNGVDIVDMVIESVGERGYKRHLAVEFYGKAGQSVNAGEGETVTVKFDTSSRKTAQGKWFTRANGWECRVDATVERQPGADDELGF